jgi:hypothetical protein
MWYNKIVWDEDGNNVEGLCEKYFVNKEEVWELYGGLGKCLMGYEIMEFWSED